MELEYAGFFQLIGLLQLELLLFAGVFFLIGSVDEMAVDAIWIWLRARGKIQTNSISRRDLQSCQLDARIAVLFPAWQESNVIESTLRHTCSAWPQADIGFFVGCYANDPATIEAAKKITSGDRRFRLVTVPHAGPTTKADCLNVLYRAVEEEEQSSSIKFPGLLLHDAEDMVDPGAIVLMDRALQRCDFVQLPVVPVAHPKSRWISAHYIEEFAEAHGKTLIVRNALGAGVPAAGVGCAFKREILERIARERGGQPFSEASLTEDYELGLSIQRLGGRSQFLRVRGEDGNLIATRAYFPGTIAAAVRQKSRWLHGIAFQSWDRLGWSDSFAENWMRLRDRRGPLAAIVLFAGYLLVVLAGATSILSWFGYAQPIELTPFLWWLMILNLCAFVWRAVMRFGFVYRDYGAAEGLRAVFRIPVANIIAILAARRATMAYISVIAGRDLNWEKTAHKDHPSELIATGRSPRAKAGPADTLA